jgi:hypothetical protein
MYILSPVRFINYNIGISAILWLEFNSEHCQNIIHSKIIITLYKFIVFFRINS